MINELTVTSVGPWALKDIPGLPFNAANFQDLFVVGGSTAAGTVVYRVNDQQWASIRPQLAALAQRRQPVSGSTTRTQPLLTYTLSRVPGGRPQLTQIEGSADVGPGALVSQTLVLRGTGFIAGVAATYTFYHVESRTTGVPTTGDVTYSAPLAVLRIDAVEKGPIGNLITLRILPAGSASVVVTPGIAGAVHIDVTPATGFSNATAIAAQLVASTEASAYVTPTALVVNGPVAPTGSIPVGLVGASLSGLGVGQALGGGDGGGIAHLDLLVSATSVTNRLRIRADKPGVQGNNITITINANIGADSVVVTGNDIVVNLTAAVDTMANIKVLLDGSAAAAALVSCTVVGAGSLGATAKTWFYGGAGETPTATVAGASASIRDLTDSSMSLVVTAAALVAASAALAEQAIVNVNLDYQTLSGQVEVISTP